MHQKTHVSLERPFFVPLFSGCLSCSSNSTSVKSLSIGCPLILSGFILLSAVRLMERSMGSWRARKKSSGPRGRPGSEDNNCGLYKRNLKCVKAEHNLLRGAFLSSKLCSFAVKDGRGDTREKAEQRRTRCLILEQDSNLRLTVQRFSGLSCQKAIKRQFPLTILAQVLKGRRVF